MCSAIFLHKQHTLKTNEKSTLASLYILILICAELLQSSCYFKVASCNITSYVVATLLTNFLLQKQQSYVKFWLVLFLCNNLHHRGVFISTSLSWLLVPGSSSQCCRTRMASQMIECYQFGCHFDEPKMRQDQNRSLVLSNTP